MLALGIKFIPTPAPLSKEELKSSFTDFFRKIKLKIFFHTNGHRGDKTFNPKWWLPNASSFCPMLEELPVAAATRISHLQEQASILINTPVSPLRLNNISKNSLRTIKKLKEDKSIIIKPADKNLGLTILDREWYVNEAYNKHLLVKKTYRPTPAKSIPIHIIIADLTQLVKNMRKVNAINEQQYIFALSCTSQYRVPVFYLLPKLHKPKLAGRPITSSVNWILHPLSKILDDMLQPFLKKTPAYLADSADLLRDLRKTTVPEDCLLFTADVESLYPSIPTPEGIDIVMKYLYECPRFSDLKVPPFLREALLLVLTNNYTEFNDDFFLQLSGTAMGTPVAVCYASLFLAALEEPILNNTNLILYRRFIDDIFVIWKSSDKKSALDFIKTLNSLHPNIKLTHELDETSVDFLDLTIYKDRHTEFKGILDTKIFQKAFNNFLYLPFSSHHPLNQKKSFIKGLLTSFLRANSQAENFYLIRNKLYFRLRNRGYPASFLHPLIRNENYDTTKRESLLLKKTKEVSNIPLTIKMQNSPSVESLKIREFLRLCKNKLSENLTTDADNIRLCLSNPKTLLAPLISSKFRPAQQ